MAQGQRIELVKERGEISLAFLVSRHSGSGKRWLSVGDSAPLISSSAPPSRKPPQINIQSKFQDVP